MMKTAKEKKLQYDLKYQKEHTKQIKFVLNERTDKDILSYLEKRKPVQTYLKKLIREQIKKER